MTIQHLLVQDEEATSEDLAPSPVAVNGAAAPQTEETPQEDPDIAKARAMGWKPQEEYKGDPEKWVDAKEFVLQGSPRALREEFNKQRKEFENFRREQLAVMKTVQEQTRKQAEEVYQRKIAELEARHKEGFEKGDYETMRLAEKAIRQEEARFNQTVAQTSTPSTNPVFEEFYGKNSAWYGVDAELTSDADAYGIGLAESIKAKKVQMGLQPTLTKEEERGILAKVETRFAPKRPAAQPPPVVAAARGTPVNTGKGKSVQDLKPEDRQILSYYQARGLYTGKEAQKFIDDTLAMY